MEEVVPAQRHIRSFALRQGHLSPAQKSALERLFPTWGIPYQAAPIDLATVFGNTNPVILEIGFGMGHTTAEIAAQHPHLNYLGVEVHTPGVGSLLKHIEQQHLQNIRIIQHDVVEVLRDMIPQHSLAGVHIFFPDPWRKVRHHKRRLIQPTFVHQLCHYLRPEGYLHCATDWQNYAEQMLDVLANEPLLHNTHDTYTPRPAHRPLTKFEQRGLNLGHGVWDLVFTTHASTHPSQVSNQSPSP
jgi:tRNA (guanine-N7-)-methyltransferase